MVRKLDLRRFPASQEEIRQARKIVMEHVQENDCYVLAELKNPRNVSTVFLRFVFNKKGLYKYKNAKKISILKNLCD